MTHSQEIQNLINTALHAPATGSIVIQGALFLDIISRMENAEQQNSELLEELNYQKRHVNVGTEGRVDHALAIKDLDHLRPFYTREGAINLIKEHWPDLIQLYMQRDDLQETVNALSHKIALANGAVLLARQQRDAALAGLSRIAKYPLTRTDELSAEQMRDIALNYHAKGLGSCQYCNGSGDVHDLDGEWRGECTECDAITKAGVK